MASGSPLPDGVYGVSPTSLQLKHSNTADYVRLNVYSSLSGSKSVLNTNFDTGYITGLTANTTYMLGVRGVKANGTETSIDLADYNVQTWDVFTNSKWNIAGATAGSGVSLDGSTYVINWDYAPWKRTPAGDHVLEASKLNCYFVPDQGTSTNPFTPTAVKISGPLSAMTMNVTAGAVGLAGNVRIGCEVAYVDGTVSRNNLTKAALFLPAVSKCKATTLDVYTPFNCPMSDVVASLGTSTSLSFVLDPSNTCRFLSVSSGAITGTPHDPDVGTCTLAFTLQAAGSGSSPLITQQITINNTAPVWTTNPAPLSPIREVSRHDSGAASGGTLNLSALLNNPSYTLHMTSGQFQTDKARWGVVDGAVYGSYKLDSTTSTNCGRLGTYSYKGTDGTMQTGINPVTGEFYFQPFEYVYGTCTVDIFFDDGHLTNHLSTDLSMSLKIFGYNDPPEIADPGFPLVNGVENYDCGSQCYVGIDYSVSLKANSGGINPQYPSITGEKDQTLFVKPGNCIAVNSNTSDTTVYVQVNLCQIDPATGNLVVGFQPIKLPPDGTTVTIAVVASDTGVPTLDSAVNPALSGSNSNCLANNPSICKSFPNTNLDSSKVTFTLSLSRFNLPIQPALIVSKAACLACHVTVESGDFITDFGNTPKGATTAGGGRFSNMFFQGADPMSSWATHIAGFRSMNQMAGSLYVKRSTLTAANNPGFFTLVGGFNGATSIDLVAFLTNPNWTYNGARYTDGYVLTPNAFASVCPGGYPGNGGISDTTDANKKVCTTANVRDTIGAPGSMTTPIQYMTISAPTVGDIQLIAQGSPGIANQINWNGTDAQVAPLYMMPTDNSRPFGGLSVSTTQPASAVPAGANPKQTVGSYITNTKAIDCYGDVVVKGDLFLETPVFNSDSRGCRIHVTGNVFFHAMATATVDLAAAAPGMTVNGTDNVGVQITSAGSILFGFTQSEIALRGVGQSAATSAANLFLPNTTDCQSNANPTVFYRYSDTNRTCSATATASTIVEDTTTLPQGYKGWNRGAAVYKGLMVNAAVVEGRYLGVFQGSVIADLALFRLGNLKFSFDPVFTGQVPFPRLQTIKSALGGHPRVIFDAGPCKGDGTDSWQCNVDAVQ